MSKASDRNIVYLGTYGTVVQRREGFVPDVKTKDMYWTRKTGVVSVYGTIEIPTKRPMKKGGWIGSCGTHLSEKRRLCDLIDGKLKAEDLDDEELRYGVAKADDGLFSAHAAWDSVHAISARIKKQIAKELNRRVDDRLNSSLIDVTDSILDLATSPSVDDAIRLKASTWVFERQRGKNPEILLHGDVKPYEEIFDDLETTSREEYRNKQIEATRLDREE